MIQGGHVVPNIKLLIADDHNLVREGISAIMRMQDDIDVVGEASDGLEAVNMTETLCPDIVLMDISMPKLGGFEATVEIKRRFPDTKIIVLTQHDDTEYIGRFLKAGVSGYIVKKALGSDLVAAVRAVAEGGSYLHPSIASEVMDGYVTKSAAEMDDPLDTLTERELQVLKLLAEGYIHKDVGEILNISAKTVITHQTHISEKLGIRSRAGLIKYAVRRNIIKV